MKLIIDTNIVISAFISPEGKTRNLLLLGGLDLFAPEFILKELKKHKEEIREKSKLSEEEFNIAIALIFSKIKLIPFEELRSFLEKAKEICPNPNDKEYFALALSKNIPIWSDDRALKEKQDVVKVYSATELIEKFLNE